MQGGNVPFIDSEKKRRLFVPGDCYLHTSLRVHAAGGLGGGGGGGCCRYLSGAARQTKQLFA